MGGDEDECLLYTLDLVALQCKVYTLDLVAFSRLSGRGGGFSALNWSDTQLLLGGTQNTIFAGRNRENRTQKTIFAGRNTENKTQNTIFAGRNTENKTQNTNFAGRNTENYVCWENNTQNTELQLIDS